jgi:hypothetical protein
MENVTFTSVFMVLDWEGNRPSGAIFNATTSDRFRQFSQSRSETQRECWWAEIGQDTKGIFKESELPYIHT